jgi:hypothetical protein
MALSRASVEYPRIMWKWLIVLMSLTAVAAHAADQPVVITGGSGGAHAWVGSATPFWIRVQNNSSTTLTTLRIRLLGDEVGGLCWKTASTDGVQACSPAPTEVGVGETLFLRGEMTARSAGDWRPQLLLSWTTSAGSPVTAVQLGNLKVDSYSWSWAQSITTSLKDLALPIVLAIAGIIYQRREKARDQDRLERETQRTDRAETLRIMLPKSHEYATKYYASLEMRSRNLSKAIAKYQKQPTPAGLDDLTFWVVSLYHANRLLMADVGAYYFKDRMGEELALGGFSALNGSIFDEQDEAGFALTALLDLLGTKMLMPQGTFNKQIEKAPRADHRQLAVLRTRLQDWMESPGWNQGFAGIEIFSAVLNFEMNRPYENWYEAKEWLDLDDRKIAAVEQLLKGMRPEYTPGIRAYIAAHRRRAT